MIQQSDGLRGSNCWLDDRCMEWVTHLLTSVLLFCTSEWPSNVYSMRGNKEQFEFDVFTSISEF